MSSHPPHSAAYAVTQAQPRPRLGSGPIRRESGIMFRSSRFDELYTLAVGDKELVVAREAGPHGYERMVVLKRALSPSPEVGASLIREALSYARLSHPAIVRLLEVVERESSVELVLEHVDGVSLEALLNELGGRQERLGVDAAIFLGARVFAALAAAHAARHPVTGEYAPVIHRDVSPANVLLPWDGFAKLGDFGFARVSGIQGDTIIGQVKGTLGYMAPEQLRGEAVSVRTDVYAGCLLLQELLTGQPAFVPMLPDLHLLGAMASSGMTSIAEQCPELPRALLEAIQLGLEPNPENRRMSAAGMLDVLRSAADLESGRRDVVGYLARLRSESAWYGGGTTRPPAAPVLPFLPSPVPLPLPPPPYAVSAPPPRSPMASLATPEPLVRSAMPVLEPRPRAGVFPWFAALLVLGCAFGVTFGWQSARFERRSEAASVAVARHRAPIRLRVPASRPAGAPTRSVSAPTSPPSPASPAAPSSPSSPSSPSPSPTAAPPPIDKTGTLVVEAHAFQRVWVDERLVGEGPHRAALPCGRHVVRIGSRGAPMEVSVPCGGEATARVR